MKVLKVVLSVILCLSVLVLSACGGENKGNKNIEPNKPLTGNSRILVAYFSWSSLHNTQTMAEYVADVTGGELFRIQPRTPYTTNYNDVVDIAQQEKKDNARPELAENLTAEQFAEYDVFFIGYPIWWYDAPMIIFTFLESHDFTGKTIVPFATSGGSGLNEEEKFRTITGAEVKDGLCISSFSAGAAAKERIRKWVDGLNLPENPPQTEPTGINSGSASVQGQRVRFTFGEQEIYLTLCDNSATRDLVKRLKESPITLHFSDYGGSEKIAYLNTELDVSDADGCDPTIGDLTIYTPWGNLAAFYKDTAGYSDSLVPVGKFDRDGIERFAKQSGEFEVVLSIAE